MTTVFPPGDKPRIDLMAFFCHKFLPKSYLVAFDDNLDELTNLLDCDDFLEDKQNNKILKGNHKPVCKSDSKSNQGVDLIEKSEIHTGDTDSSDDEDNKYSAEQKYSETGRAIKNTLKKSHETNLYFNNPTWKTKKTAGTQHQSTPGTNSSVSLPTKVTTNDIYSDPFFGIRIITPLVSSQSLKDKMSGKTTVTFSRLEKHLIIQDNNSSDWVLAGVIVSKFVKTSQKGKPYACWTLSDLRDDLSTVSIFLFGSAYKNLWKTSTHTVVAILNATPLENRKSSKDIAALSVLNSDQVMIWGQSKDLGYCKSLKKNGEPCTSFINKSKCEFCVYHVKQEYRKFTGRSELQASCGGSLTQLRNKVIGKNEVFYAGKSFTSITAKPSKKHTAKDKTRLSTLFNQCESRFGPESLSKRPLSQAQSSRVQLMKDAGRLQKLTGSPATLSSLALQGQGPGSKKFVARKPSTSTPAKIGDLSLKDKLCGLIKNNTTARNELPSSKQVEMLKSKTDDCMAVHLTSKDKSVSAVKPNRTATKQPEKLNKAQEKSVPVTGNKCVSNKKFGNVSKLSSGKTVIGSSSKKQPTKNRFEKLINITSSNHETNNLDVVENTCKNGSSRKSIPSMKSIDMFDVCFEFDNDKEDSKASNNERVSNKAELKRKLGSNKSENIPAKRSIKEPAKNDDGISLSDDLKKSPYSHLNKSLSSTTPGKNTPVIQLRERQSPNEFELQLNGTKQQQLTFSQDKTKIKAVEPTAECPVPAQSIQNIVSACSPKLGQLNSPRLTVPRRTTNAKMKALRYIKLKGPIQKEDPKNIDKKRKQVDNEDGAKALTLNEAGHAQYQANWEVLTRQRPILGPFVQTGKGGSKCQLMKSSMVLLERGDHDGEQTLMSKRFLELMNETSKHLDLISNSEDKAIDEYYNKMEQKEKMEEKMLSTYKIDCKAFKCLKCKYKWFSPSELCKLEKHPIKVISAVKRFFQCHNCKNRTVSLEIIPLHNCNNCGQANWERAPMMRERKITSTQLSIRGGEQRFVNSVETNVNLDLLVPDS